MPIQLIVNADDFGFSNAVNMAVVKARQQGLLTSASLMVAGDAAAEAVAIAKDDPGLAVGLHLVLSSGKACLPREMIPNLVSRESMFSLNPALAAFRYYIDPRSRLQLRLEIKAQFEAFAETGLPLSHVDGHQHLHTHPAALPTVIEFALKYGAQGIRVPSDPFIPNIRADRSRLASKTAVALGHSYLARGCRRLLRNSGLATCDIVIGSLMSGMMNTHYLAAMLRSVNCKTCEVFFHPSESADGDHSDPYGPNPEDLQALIDPVLRQLIGEIGCELTNYAGVRRQELEGTNGHLR